MRADLENAIAFLLARPTFAGTVTTGRSWSSGSDLPMMIDTEIIDNWNGHQPGQAVSGSINPSQYFCQVPGWYLCRSAPAFNYTSSTQAMFAGGLEGLTGGVAWGPQRGPLTLCGSTHAPIANCIDLIQMTVTGAPGGSGDYVQFDAFQNSGSPVNLVNNSTFQPVASARWVCATSGTQPLPVPPLTAVPTPITAAWLNSNLRDTIRYLVYPPICRAFYSNTGSSLSSGTFPAGISAPLNSATVDNYSAFNTTSHTWTAPIAGRYIVAGQFSLNSNSGTTGYCCGVSVNGGSVLWGDSVYKVSDSSGGGAAFCRRMRFSQGDTLQLMACQGSGGAIQWNNSGTNPTRLITVWEGI